MPTSYDPRNALAHPKGIDRCARDRFFYNGTRSWPIGEGPTVFRQPSQATTCININNNTQNNNYIYIYIYTHGCNPLPWGHICSYMLMCLSPEGAYVCICLHFSPMRAHMFLYASSGIRRPSSSSGVRSSSSGIGRSSFFWNKKIFFFWIDRAG